jgi:solute carrier family 30 (zinc transporter), member 2
MGAAPGQGCTHDHGDGEHGHAHEGGDIQYHGGHKEEGHAHGEPKKKEARRNINVDAAFLHALGDMIMSIGVCVAGTIIYFQPTWVVADPICTFVFSVIVCFTVTPIVKSCINVLMEGAPTEIDAEELVDKIRGLGDDVDVYNFHLWSISLGKYALMAHVTTTQKGSTILKKINKICKKDYNIENLAIQIMDISDPSNVKEY